MVERLHRLKAIDETLVDAEEHPVLAIPVGAPRVVGASRDEVDPYSLMNATPPGANAYVAGEPKELNTYWGFWYAAVQYYRIPE